MLFFFSSIHCFFKFSLSYLYLKILNLNGTFAITCSLEKDEGPPHDKKYVSSVQIPTVDGILYIKGDEKSRVKEAPNSTASWIIRALQESNYLLCCSFFRRISVKNS